MFNIITDKMRFLLRTSYIKKEFKKIMPEEIWNADEFLYRTCFLLCTNACKYKVIPTPFFRIVRMPDSAYMMTRYNIHV